VRIFNLTEGSAVYTCNAYLVLGTYSAIPDVNALVDAGNDPCVRERLERAPTGVGKRKLDRILLTHSHYDHAGQVPLLQQSYGAEVLAGSPYLAGVDRVLRGGDAVRMGDRAFEVISTPGHTDDSLCFYCEQERLLFAGDTPLVALTPEGSYEPGFVAALEGLCQRRIDAIYFGHGPPLLAGAATALRRSLDNAQESFAGRRPIC
jgi:glyoxylase-like metal-dependent hydrolase (beta-lactamase superfamily II)